MKEYNHTKIERKWQLEWEKKKIYQAFSISKKKKFYSLIEFPYPSGDGLHVGHVRAHVGMDIVSRKKRMEGHNVLYPIGWDAFGLPAENYAIKTGKQPKAIVKKNTDTFRKQIKSVGISFDWSREINTTDPAYYKWTQWLFLQFFKKGLAYKTKSEINWCPKDKIGLANEEVVDGKCERCGTPTEKKEKEQWMLAITKYAERLDKDLDLVDYPARVKSSQRNWIGKSVGSEIEFKTSINRNIKVFTTRADTLFGVTYVVLAPEHANIGEFLVQSKNMAEVSEYVRKVKNKTEIERTGEDKEKTGIELKGIKAINPANGEEIPVYVADYVLAGYGTGAVMAVPAHDERDLLFAKKYNLPIKRVVEPKFVASEGDAKVHTDLPFIKRDAICAIIRNPKNDKYLCTSWKNYHMHGLVTGGIDQGEDPVEAALREIKEETGYKNVKLVKNPNFALHSQFYHRVKKENRWARFQYFFFELIDEEKDIVNKKEISLHDVVWKTKEEIKTFFTVIEGQFTFNFINDPEYIFTEDGILHFSGQFDDMESEEARKKITEFVGGKMVTKFKLRDWVFSRQRYWGEPIPVVNCEKCEYVPVKEKDLPVKLPEVKSYKPTDNGESPLAAIHSWVNTKCPKCGGKAKRETDTMPNWAGSSWYYLRYVDPKNKKKFASKKNLKYWTPVDWYNGGMEHTTLHLLYSRFWHKFFYDLKLVPTKEPYMKRTSHGMILGEGGVKMSKSLGNVINPDEIVKIYGADTLRVYEMFMGPFEDSAQWNTESIIGSRRFIEKVWRIGTELNKNYAGGRFRPKDGVKPNNLYLTKLLHKTIKKVEEDIEGMRFNTAISAMMILATEMEKVQGLPLEDYKKFLKILAPFAPHVTEEIWREFGEKKTIHLSEWPKWDKEKIIDDEVKIAIQINGKVRTEIMINVTETEEEIKKKVVMNEIVL
ncbi:MAG: class I tRNA ligase family protein, partial [bacterium]